MLNVWWIIKHFDIPDLFCRGDNSAVWFLAEQVRGKCWLRLWLLCVSSSTSTDQTAHAETQTSIRAITLQSALLQTSRTASTTSNTSDISVATISRLLEQMEGGGEGAGLVTVPAVIFFTESDNNNRSKMFVSGLQDRILSDGLTAGQSPTAWHRTGRHWLNLSSSAVTQITLVNSLNSLNSLISLLSNISVLAIAESIETFSNFYKYFFLILLRYFCSRTAHNDCDTSVMSFDLNASDQIGSDGTKKPFENSNDLNYLNVRYLINKVWMLLDLYNFFPMRSIRMMLYWDSLFVRKTRLSNLLLRCYSK